MTTRFFSTRKRAPHLGALPLEELARGPMPDLATVPPPPPLSFDRPEDPQSIVNAMRDHQATMDAIRSGMVNKVRAACPDDLVARANHLKAFGYFCDATAVGIGPMLTAARLDPPRRNPDIDRLARDLGSQQTKSLAAGIDLIMADLREAMAAPAGTIDNHAHVVVVLAGMPRDPRPSEPGYAWLRDAQAHRACLRASEVAVVLASYIRLLGWEATAHTGTATDIDLNKAAVAAGLAMVEEGRVVAPFLGERFGAAALTTTMPLAQDAPLAVRQPRWSSRGMRRRGLRDPFEKRDFAAGPHPMESLKRVERPTTYIDEAHVPRVPKRTDMFIRAQFGDLGKPVQEAATAGRYVRKSAPSSAQRRMLGAFVLLQDGEAPDGARPTDAACNAANIKAASYFLGVDAVGISRCPDWTWYSHDATGAPIDPPHDQAISMIIDQGFETMEGASGDDWISVAQSMRAYLRFSLLGGVIARQIRTLGFQAKAHTVMDGDVLQPPLLLLSGLGEVSRIGEVILNPFLGPRLKSGVVTTDMPLAHDAPIDFGLQRFCESCNKCARECPSGAITAGPKRMFNGYEIWKSDSQKCATYRITTTGGAMCGRCMKTCPWNLEGLFAEKPFRWAAMTLPGAAPYLAKLDDALGRGGLNPVKKWWWDLELAEDGGYEPTRHPVNARGLQRSLKLAFEDQTLAVYPANLAPPPWPYPFAMEREAGIRAYRDMISADDYRKRRAAGETGPWDHRYTEPPVSPVVEVVIAEVKPLSATVTLYRFHARDGGPLPAWNAGAHIDVVISPDRLRQYSLTGDPADRSCYTIAVQREVAGRGGSELLHRVFAQGRRVFVSKPINHFPLVPQSRHVLLMGGGIGVTPLIAMAHELHRAKRSFTLHYSVSRRQDAAFADHLADVPWRDAVHLHVTEEGSRADLGKILAANAEGWHVYACGPDAYMDAVMAHAASAGFPETARHVEYFSVPDMPAYQNHPFRIRLRDGQLIAVSADQSAAEALVAQGIRVDLKCSDGLCGVCRCRVLSGAVEHRDFVLSQAERAEAMILCQSRAAQKDGVIALDL